MTLTEVKKEITKMRDNAAAKVESLKFAESDDEFAELNYYNGQQVALNQALSWLSKLTSSDT